MIICFRSVTARMQARRSSINARIAAMRSRAGTLRRVASILAA